MNDEMKGIKRNVLTRIVMHKSVCVCVLWNMFMPVVIKGFLCVFMFMFSRWGGNRCAVGQLPGAIVYSKVDYFFGPVLLTITKSFCSRENSSRKLKCLLSPLNLPVFPPTKKRVFFFPCNVSNTDETQSGVCRKILWKKKLFIVYWCWCAQVHASC